MRQMTRQLLAFSVCVCVCSPELMYLAEQSVLVSNLIERMQILLHHTVLSLCVCGGVL